MKKKLFIKKKTFRFKRFENKSYSAYNSMHKIVTIGVLSLTAFITADLKTANCQTNSNVDTLQTKTLEEITISDEAAVPINQAGRVVTVITQKDIEHLKVNNINELLLSLASVDVQTRGTHGVQSDVSLRGGNFDQTAILLNGVNITNPHTGHYSLDIPINISDIEKIEILKGPAAIIYGASAFSGGINIITKKSIKKSLNAQIEGGQHGYYNANTSISKQLDNVENYLSVGYKHSDGYIDNTDYDIINALYQNRWNINSQNKIDFMVGYNQKSYGASTFYSAKYPNQHDKTKSFLCSVKGLFALSDNLTIIPTAYYNLHTDEFELIKDVSKPNHHKSNVLGNNVTIRYKYNNFKLNFGSDVRYEEILSNVLGNPISIHGNYDHGNERINFSYFLQGNYAYKNLLITLGVMSFQNTAIQQDIFNFYPSLNINWRIKNSELYLSANTSSRLPSFTELYYKDAVHEANNKLKQEKSQSIEIGFKNYNHILISSISAYYMHGNNMIDWMKNNATDEKWLSRNLNELNKYGVDVEGKVFLNEIITTLDSKCSMKIGYSFLWQDQADVDYISSYALNYLKHKITAGLSLPIISDLTLNLNARYCVREGSYIDYSNSVNGEEKKYEPYFVMDCNIDYAINKFTFYVNLTNILDKRYYDIGNIPQSGFWLIVDAFFSIY